MPTATTRATLQAKLAKTLRRERLRLGWTQERAAESAGINIRHYQKLEDGAVNATLRTLEGLARGFRIDPVELFRS